MAYIPLPEVVALIRRRYQEGATIRAISAESGITNLNILYRCVKGDYPDGSALPPAPIQLRQRGVRVRHRKGSRTALVARMWRTAERQVEEIEERAAVVGLDVAERESNARILSVVARTLRELTAVDQARKTRGKEAKNEDDDDAAPRNVDELRRALAEKLESLIERRTAGMAGESAGQSSPSGS